MAKGEIINAMTEGLIISSCDKLTRILRNGSAPKSLVVEEMNMLRVRMERWCKDNGMVLGEPYDPDGL